MKAFLVILAVFLTLHTCNTYILLSANMEDVRALAQQLAASPAVDQLKKMWRRASEQFQKELDHQTRRRGGETVEEEHEEETESDRRTRRIIRELVALGKESGYLEPIQQVLQKLNS